MKEMFKLGGTLAAFALVACVALALVDSVTGPVIREAAEKKANAALQTVFPNATSFEAKEGFQAGDHGSIQFERVVLAKNGDEALGVAMQLTGPTYDKATMIVATDTEGKVVGTSFLALTDTPGFGQKATESGYMDQFNGKTKDDKFAVGEDVQAISGATITSKGLAEMIKAACIVASDFLKAGGQ